VTPDELAELARLSTRVEGLEHRIDRAEVKSDEHFDKIFGRMDSIDAAINIGKGKASMIGWIASSIALAISAAVGAIASQMFGPPS